MSSLQEQLAALNNQSPDESSSGDDALASSTDTKQGASVEKTARTLVSTVTGVAVDAITESALLNDDLSVSSLDLIEIAVRCEQVFHAPTDADRYLHMRTFGDLVAYCRQAG